MYILQTRIAMKRAALTFFRILATLSVVGLVLWLTGAHQAPGKRSLLLIPGFLGLGIAVWASKLNPHGAKIGPTRLPSKLIKHGPYRFVRHPMYTGQWLAITFFMWYGAGFWAAFSIALLAEVMFREYIWREEGGRTADGSDTETAVTEATVNANH